MNHLMHVGDMSIRFPGSAGFQKLLCSDYSAAFHDKYVRVL